MRHVITAVHGRLCRPVAPAFSPGDVLLKLNGEDVQDEIDYQALSAQPDAAG